MDSRPRTGGSSTPSEAVFAQTCLRNPNAKSSVPVVIPLRDIASSLHTLPYHLIGKKHGLDPHWCRLGNGGTHWWLWHPDKHEYLDPTFEQAAQPFPYDQGRRCLLYVRRHKRSSALLHCVRKHLQ